MSSTPCPVVYSALRTIVAARRSRTRLSSITMLGAVALLGACVATDPALRGAMGDGPGELSRVQWESLEAVRDLPRSRSGNAPEYTVFGQRYWVLDSADQFVEEGIASWYGSKFHGRATASGEIYDMHAMTAAHKSLPLPVFVRVTRTDTGKSVVVKVNDRGPFVDDRIIDLSYAAAARLGMLDSGTAPVRIEALSRHVDEQEAVKQTDSPVEVTDVASASDAVEVSDERRWVQFGAFRHLPQAVALQSRLIASLGIPVGVVRDEGAGLFRVAAGPFADAVQLDSVIATLTAEAPGVEAIVRTVW